MRELFLYAALKKITNKSECITLMQICQDVGLQADLKIEHQNKTKLIAIPSCTLTFTYQIRNAVKKIRNNKIPL